MTSFGVIRPGHEAAITATGHREQPEVLHASCSCGWEGLAVVEPWFDPQGTEFPILAEPFRSVAERFGPAQILKPNEVYGKRPAAVIQVLHHLEYDPEEDLARAQATFKAAVKAFQEAKSYEAATAKRRLLNQAAQHVVSAYERNAVWAQKSLPLPTPRNSEAQAILDAHWAEVKQKDAAAAARPLTDKEAAVLQTILGDRS